MQDWITRCRGFARDWLPVMAWTVFIYGCIPLARAVQEWVTEHWTRAAFSWVVYASVVLGVLAAVRHFRRRAEPMTRRQWVVLLTLAAIFAWGTWHLRGNAEEAMHLLQYGVLSLLLHRAYSRRYADRGVYACAALLGAFLGIFDEVIQWAVPRRFFDFRDMVINVLAVLLIQGGLAAGLATRCRQIPASHRSARAAWRLAALVLLLLLGCLSNTPDVWRPFYSYRPGLFVFDETMVEYGHRIVDPGVGTFKSRLTAEQLRSEDATRAEEVAEVLRQLGRDDQYEAFLQQYSAVRDPFLHELRVRLFRRDRYWNYARANRDDPVKHANLISISFAEQRLLENWYPHTLRASGRDWPTDLRARAEAASHRKPYTSWVSHSLITSFTERQAQTVLGSLLLVVAVGGAYDVRRRRRKMETP
ncbi:MAG TPA: VanZ family protein [Kiritimatiellia bacterium]|nr:VanZ family protein [Kiritimatiellia bacterium]